MNILITGATGSFGRAFTKNLLRDGLAKRIVIYSRDEHKQEEMARELGAWGVNHPVLRFFIGDVRSPSRLEMAMRGIDTVVHAAAMKIVPTAEYNPTECIATNIGGAENVIHVALRTGVKKVLALSTDKAVNPINLYGATKLAAEKVFIAANALAAGDCKFSVMRYGNVCGSNGSVVPLFRKMLLEGKSVTVTDGQMTRFWITMDQAVAFAQECLAMIEGEEVFVPKIPSIRIVNLAKAMGAEQCVFTGIRPGEKLHEVLISADERPSTTEYSRHYVIRPNGKVISTPDGWCYASNTNKWWLDIDQIKETIK